MQSHQRSWWFVHTRPTRELGKLLKSHQRSWWIVHTQPGADQTERESAQRVRLGMNNPPTALVVHQLRWWDSTARGGCAYRLSMNEPPTALVGTTNCVGGII